MTTYNTGAVNSEDGQSELDLASLPPLEGYNFRGLVFEETDVVDLSVEHNGKAVKLMSYRWAPENERKGVIFMLHGYGSCAPQMAVLAKFLAQGDYEVFALDYRGHGDSEGERGTFLSTEQVYNDCWALIFESCKKFKIDQQRTPIFLFGRSFGGLLATNMANTTIGKCMFSGVVLLTPYYRLFTEKLYEAYKWLIPLTNVRPNHKFMCEFSEMDPDWAARYKPILEDPRNVNHFTATTARMWIEQQELARTSISEAPQPICFIAATEDGVVRNDYIEDFAELSLNQQNEYHHVVGADHTDVVFDENYGSQVIRATTNFLDKLIDGGEPAGF